MIIRGQKLRKGKQLKGCMIYPDFFANGIANLGWQDIVWCTKEKVDWRIIFFDEEIYLYDEILDFSIDEADIILFSIPFESTYLNTVKMLRKYNLLNANKKPVVIAGGMSMINPFPLGLYFDAVVVGSGSHIINNIIEIISNCGNKSDKLSEILRLDGIFSLLDRNKYVKALISNPNHLYYSHWTSDSSRYELDRYFSIMISMGCNGVCPYCVVGNTQGNEKHNAINYSFNLVKTILNNELPYHYPQVVKLFFASGESNIDSTIQNFMNMGLNVRVGSLNIKQLHLDLLNQLRMNGQNEVTIAPETIQPLRKSIGKGYFTDDLLFEKIELVSKQKMDLTLYYLCGLVEERKSSLGQFIEHIDRISNYIQADTNVNIHYNPLFPKAQTPMQNYKMLNLDIIREHYGILKEKISVDKRFSITSIIDDSLAFYQPILSLCDERAGDALYQLADIDNPSEEEWELAFREAGINTNDFISLSYNDRKIETPLCFSSIKY